MAKVCPLRSGLALLHPCRIFAVRFHLAERREPYWTVISAGNALGYRRGVKGGTWIAKFRDDSGKRHLEALGAADDARDADGLSVFSFAQAQERARSWFERKARERSGDFVPLGRTYTIADALVEYRADYQHRSGKATDRLDASAGAWILPELGPVPLDKLTKGRVVAWHLKMAETPPRLRTKPGAEAHQPGRAVAILAAQKHQEVDISPEGVRRRRSTANRVLTILKAALNHAYREGRFSSDDAWRSVRAFREVDAARLRYLSDEEARRLTNACAADFRALVTGALVSGCRYSELASMTVRDFNPDAGTLQVRTSKGRQTALCSIGTRGPRFRRCTCRGTPGKRAFVPSRQRQTLGEIRAATAAHCGLCGGTN
jgi:integrase